MLCIIYIYIYIYINILYISYHVAGSYVVCITVHFRLFLSKKKTLLIDYTSVTPRRATQHTQHVLFVFEELLFIKNYAVILIIIKTQTLSCEMAIIVGLCILLNTLIIVGQ